MDIKFLIAASFIAIIICGCTSQSSVDINKDKYIAIQETIYKSGTIIYGNYPYPGMAQPPAIFKYNVSLSPSDNYPEISDSLKVLYGVILNTESPEGLTSEISVKGVYRFPDQPDSNVVIVGADDNGTVQMKFHNTPITLKAGETWKSPVVDEGLEVKNATDYSYVESYNTTYEFTNLGMFNKSDLAGRRTVTIK